MQIVFVLDKINYLIYLMKWKWNKKKESCVYFYCTKPHERVLRTDASLVSSGTRVCLFPETSKRFCKSSSWKRASFKSHKCKCKCKYLLIVKLSSQHFRSHPVGGADHGQWLFLHSITARHGQVLHDQVKRIYSALDLPGPYLHCSLLTLVIIYLSNFSWIIHYSVT